MLKYMNKADKMISFSFAVSVYCMKMTKNWRLAGGGVGVPFEITNFNYDANQTTASQYKPEQVENVCFVKCQFLGNWQIVLQQF